MTFCAPDDRFSWVLHAQSMEIHPERGGGNMGRQIESGRGTGLSALGAIPD